MTRTLETPLVIADALVQAIDSQTNSSITEALERLRDQGAHELRGRIWTCDRADLPKVSSLKVGFGARLCGNGTRLRCAG